MPGARNKHLWTPSVLSLPSNLQTGHKGFSVPSLNGISHSDVLPVWGSISYFHLVLSFPVGASEFVCVQGFSHFSISELFLSAGNNPHVSLLSHFAPCLGAPRIIHHPCFYLFLFSQLLFLCRWPPFPLPDSPVSIAMPFDQTSSLYSTT